MICPPLHCAIFCQIRVKALVISFNKVDFCLAICYHSLQSTYLPRRPLVRSKLFCFSSSPLSLNKEENLSLMALHHKAGSFFENGEVSRLDK